MIYILLLSLSLLCSCEENEKVHNLAEDIIDIAEEELEKETGIKVDVQLPEKHEKRKEKSSEKSDEAS